jgi:hypothetical protein
MIPVDYFKDNIEKNWVIDKLWTDDEKIELGIIEKNESVTLFEFSSMIEEISTSLRVYQEEVKELAEKKKSDIKLLSYKLKELFNIERGISKYTKKYGNTNKGNYPIYSASNREALTSISTFDYDGEFLTWATNGFAGYIKILTGKFSINADRGLLKPKKDGLNIFYVKYKIEPILRSLAKGRKGEKGEDEFTKVYPSMIEDIEISMPMDEQGNFDISAQAKIVEKYEFVEDINAKIAEYKTKIEDLNVDIENLNKTLALKIKDIFDLSIKTNSSSFTKSFIEKNKGSIPVYSASKFPESVDYGYVENNLKNVKYFEDCLTWNIDGSVGKVHYRKGRFSLSEKVIPLILKDKFKIDLDIPFLKYTIEKEFSKHSFGFDNKAGKGKIQEIEIQIPVNSKGKFDLAAQKEIANKYQKIEDIKALIKTELDKLSQANVFID